MNPSIPILFEDKDILAVDKPEGLASIPERSSKAVDLLGVLTEQTGMKLFVVHRLDKDVSGVILFAKNGEAHKILNEQFAERSIRKTYFAFVHGAVKLDKASIQKPIRQFGSGRMGIDLERGKASTTEYEVVQRMDQFTLMKVYPRTGRRHQIRVHLYSEGHPIVGDLLYGELKRQQQFPRLMLHSYEVELELPSKGHVTIQSLIPPSFRVVTAKLTS